VQEDGTIEVNNAPPKNCDFTADALVMATGLEGIPNVPEEWAPVLEMEASLRGRDIGFPRVLHSSDYRNGKAYRGKRVAVLGFGNSGAEIAMDLYEHGAACVDVLARSPVHIVPRWLSGIFGRLYSLIRSMPVDWVDGLGPYLQPVLIGDLSAYNITLRDTGVVEDVRHRGRAPIIDIGVLDLTKRGWIRIRGPGESGTVESVRAVDLRGRQTRDLGAAARFPFLRLTLGDGHELEVDALVLATGFTPRGMLGFLSPDVRACLDDQTSGFTNWAAAFGDGRAARACAPRLWGIGYTDFIGRLAEMNRESRLIAAELHQEGLLQG